MISITIFKSMGNAEERPRAATDKWSYRAELNYLCPFIPFRKSCINLTGARLQYKQPQRGGGGRVGFGMPSAAFLIIGVLRTNTDKFKQLLRNDC